MVPGRQGNNVDTVFLTPTRFDRQAALRLIISKDDRQIPINLALDYTDPHESTYALLPEAEKASLRAKGLSQQLLTFAKGGEPVRKTTSIAEIITDSSSFPGGMGGEHAVKEILAIHPEAKILVSSGYANDPIMANYADYGFCGAIVKPYQMHELNKIIQNVLE